jgi:hypothetical protein
LLKGQVTDAVTGVPLRTKFELRWASSFLPNRSRVSAKLKVASD